MSFILLKIVVRLQASKASSEGCKNFAKAVRKKGEWLCASCKVWNASFASVAKVKRTNASNTHRSSSVFTFATRFPRKPVPLKALKGNKTIKKKSVAPVKPGKAIKWLFIYFKFFTIP